VGARRPQARARALQALSRDFGIDLDVPFSRLPRKSREVLLFGAGKAVRRADAEPAPPLREGSWAEQDELEPYRSLRPCPTVPRTAAEASRACR
jgi:hypothetical protein